MESWEPPHDRDIHIRHNRELVPSTYQITGCPFRPNLVRNTAADVHRQIFVGRKHSEVLGSDSNPNSIVTQAVKRADIDRSTQ